MSLRCMICGSPDPDVDDGRCMDCISAGIAARNSTVLSAKLPADPTSRIAGHDEWCHKVNNPDENCNCGAEPTSREPSKESLERAARTWDKAMQHRGDGAKTVSRIMIENFAAEFDAVAKAAKLEPCSHPSLDGIDVRPNGPEKIWLCRMCDGFFRQLADGTWYAVDPKDALQVVERAAKLEALEKLRPLSDKAYCDFIDQVRRDACLGAEQKLKEGKFGLTELEAHKKAGELLGIHRGLAAAIRKLKGEA